MDECVVRDHATGASGNAHSADTEADNETLIDIGRMLP